MYFSWTPYPFRRPPELEGQHGPQAPVLVVGAGPTGLTLALSLARLGIRSVVVEARNEVSRGSRAAGISRRSLQVFDRIGVAQTILRHALRRTGTHNGTYWGHRLLHASPFDDPAHEPHPGTVLLQQCWIEQILVDQVLACPLVDLRWSTRIESLVSASDRVEATLSTPAGRYVLAAEHLVAADGARSTVRQALGLRYEGARHDDPFVIIDFSMPTSLEGGRRVWFDPPYDPQATTILHRFPFDVWRLDALLAGADDPVREAQPERARQRVAAHLAMMGVQAPWQFIDASLYRVSMLSLPTYSAGRIFFAGDAAHLIPIWSGRGMNHGIEDAANLAWKLAAVSNRQAPSALLDSYHRERHAAIQATVRPLARTTRFMTASTPGLKLMRDAVLSLSSNTPWARELFDPRRIVDPPYRLHTPEADHGFAAGLEPGALVPDRWLDGVTGNGAAVSLHDLLGPGFTGLYFAPDTGVPAAVAQALSALCDEWPDTALLIIGARPLLAPRAKQVHDANGELRKLFGAAPGGFYLLRPDDRVAARWTQFDAAAVHGAHGAALAGAGGPSAEQQPSQIEHKERIEDTLLALADRLETLQTHHAPLFLAKLALLLVEMVEDRARLSQAIEAAAQQLEPAASRS